MLAQKITSGSAACGILLLKCVLEKCNNEKWKILGSTACEKMIVQVCFWSFVPKKFYITNSGYTCDACEEKLVSIKVAKKRLLGEN